MLASFARRQMLSWPENIKFLKCAVLPDYTKHRENGTIEIFYLGSIVTAPENRSHIIMFIFPQQKTTQQFH